MEWWLKEGDGKTLMSWGLGQWGSGVMESRGGFLEQLLSMYGVSFVDKEEGL